MKTLGAMPGMKVNTQMDESWPFQPERPVVLVVDDDDSMRAVARAVLEHAGYAVHTASGGVEALDFLASSSCRVTAILLDVIMPGMDGLATLNAIRNMTRPIPVVLFSGSDDIDSRLGVQRPDAFLKKPFSIVELRQAIRQAVRNRAAHVSEAVFTDSLRQGA